MGLAKKIPMEIIKEREDLKVTAEPMFKQGTENTTISVTEPKIKKNIEDLPDSTEPNFNVHRGWRAMPYIIGNETFEKLGTIGSTANMLIYLTSVFHMKKITAALLMNIWMGTSNLAPLLGAFLADTYFGRYHTIAFASILSFLGMLVLVLTSAIDNLHPPQCIKQPCVPSTTWQYAFLYLGFLLLVLGSGGIRPCNLAFGADQFDPRTDSGRKGINSFFNWYIFTLTFAVVISLTFIIYIQSNISWTLGLGIPTFLMLVSCVLFFWGSKIYVKIKPKGSPFTSMFQVISAAFKKRSLKQSNDPHQQLFDGPFIQSGNSKLSHTNQFMFLDKAAIRTNEDHINASGLPMDPWRLCSVQQVEELKCILRVVPIWMSCVFFSTAMEQLATYAVFQALQSDRHLTKNFQIPAATYGVISMIFLTLYLPIYDRVIVPLLRKTTNRLDGITLLQRMGTGVFLSIIAMIISGIVEVWRRKSALDGSVLPNKNHVVEVSSMSGLWLVPQLALGGIAAAFNSVAEIEFLYKEFPENMRSVAGSMLFCSMAVGSYMSSLMIGIVHYVTKRGKNKSWLNEDLNYGRLDYFYYSVAMLEVVNFAYFLFCAKWYKYKERIMVENGLEEKERGILL